jgi:hypothetical protein
MKTVCVECLSDLEYADRPLSLIWQGRRYEIAEILARWRGPAEKGFRVKTMDGFAFEYFNISLISHTIPSRRLDAGNW